MNILVPHNIEGRKDKMKQILLKKLQQEIIEGDKITFEYDLYKDIPDDLVKVKQINGYVSLKGGWPIIPKWLSNVKINGYFDCSYNHLTTLENC
jgi:hypothetical protein